MTRYKLMFRERGKKKYYNFGPTIHTTAKARYSRINSMKKANAVKRELERNFTTRTWKIKKKY
jgi:hypothetical protein